MFSFLITRLPKSAIHIITYQLSTGSYRTVCGKSFGKNLNVLSADNIFPGICNDCKEYFKKRYQNYVRYDPASAHHEFFNKYYDLVDLHRDEIMGPRDSYSESFDRSSRAIKKYQRLLKKRK